MGNAMANIGTTHAPSSFSFPHLKLSGSYRSLRELNLFLNLLNKISCSTIYWAKMTCLTLSILGGFAGIRLAQQNPVLAFIYVMTGLQGCVAYIVPYQLAYGVTEKMAEFKGAIERRVRMKGVSIGERKYCQRILKSIPEGTIKVGSFYTIEKGCVVDFLQFVFEQILGLLLTV